MRATFKTVKESTIPQALGICAGDSAGLAAVVNEAQQRLVYAGKDSGWWEGWQKVRFSVTRSAPYITLPREIARVINMAICAQPIYIHNEFYEVLPGGPGVMPDQASCCADWCGKVAGYERGVWPTKVDLTTTNQRLRMYLTDSRDEGTKVTFNALDKNGNQIYDMNGLSTVHGFDIALLNPFADSDFDVSVIKSMSKPLTYGDVLLYQVDQTTGAEVLLSRYLASETNPAYRRYYIYPLCEGCEASFSVTAIGKLEFIPVVRDTDPLIIGNLPALKEMCQAIRGFGQEVLAAHTLAEQHEKRAIKLLKQEMDHYLGVEQPAVAVDRLQQASFRRVGLSTNI